MTNLYVTADAIGAPSGGGVVTANEARALAALGPCDVWGRGAPLPVQVQNDPWGWDQYCVGYGVGNVVSKDHWPALAHFYAGTFTEFVRLLKNRPVKISYTAAAHDVDVSRKAHQDLGLPFDYPHLNEPELWDRYVGGYRAADLVICPSQHSATQMRKYGCKNVVVIPHGVDPPPPEKLRPPPRQFRVGYLGSYGPDKGVRYLLEAWKRLAYRDATLVLGGRDSTGPWVQRLVTRYGGGSVEFVGWVKDVTEFYSQCSVYCQSSVTEGYGIEVLEAMACGRPVIVSEGCGAVDLISDGVPKRGYSGRSFPVGDVDRLAGEIDRYRKLPDHAEADGRYGREHVAPELTWDKVRARYAAAWKELLA